MGRTLDELSDELIEWIGVQHMFFVATAPLDPKGHVNLSPKGDDSFRVLTPTRVAYLDLTGSAAETIAHLRDNGRITIMFCAFEGKPRILRLFGTGTSHPVGSAEFDEFGGLFPERLGARSIITVDLDRVQLSCGYGVPSMEFVDDREDLRRWADRKGHDALVDYRHEKNSESIDGLPGFVGPTA